MVHDSGIGVAEFKGILETAAPYIDYYKFRSMTHALYPEEITLQKITLLKEHKIKPFMGGNVAELAYVRGTLEEHLAYTKEHGWEATEISETYVTYPDDIKSELIKRCADDGLEVFYEWGLKHPKEPLDPKDAAKDIRGYLDAGVTIAIIEEGEIDMLIGKDGQGENGGRLRELFDLVGPENLMVECGAVQQVGWFMREMGTVINIGNLNCDQAIEIEPLRRGIGRPVDYAIYRPYLDKNLGAD
jgi:phosphosulfolactate synthase